MVRATCKHLASPISGKALDEKRLVLINRLIARLERLSADSYWSHRASGLRGSLLHYMERIEARATLNNEETDQLEQLVEHGFKILEQAAREIGVPK